MGIQIGYCTDVTDAVGDRLCVVSNIMQDLRYKSFGFADTYVASYKLCSSYQVCSDSKPSVSRVEPGCYCQETIRARQQSYKVAKAVWIALSLFVTEMRRRASCGESATVKTDVFCVAERLAAATFPEYVCVFGIVKKKC